jgi:hypothetical protein
MHQIIEHMTQNHHHDQLVLKNEFLYKDLFWCPGAAGTFHACCICWHILTPAMTLSSHI